MAYAEKRGNGAKPWRVKYMTPTGERPRSGFATKQEALNWGNAQEAAIREQRWNDPRKGDMRLGEWVKKWTEGQDLAETTEENYAYHLRTHILPAFEKRPLSSLDALEIEEWQKGIRARGYKPSSVTKARTILSTILEDAVAERLIGSNPASKKRRRGRQDIHVETTEEESLWCTAYQALLIAERAAILSGRPDEFVLVLLAAWTGMRFGEVRGLQRKFCQLGSVRVQWQLREVRGVYTLAPPKHNRRRTLPLPPFLTALLSDHLQRVAVSSCECHRLDFVFRPAGDTPHWSRSSFGNQVFKLAADGRPVQKAGRARTPVMVDESGLRVQPRRGFTPEKAATAKLRPARASWLPIVEGLTVHDMKHAHKVMMIRDGIPEVAQSERLAHKIQGVQGIYSHVAPEFRQQILDGLQAQAVAAFRRRARMGPSCVPVLQALLEPHLGPWKMTSQIPPIGGAKILEMRRDQAV